MSERPSILQIISQSRYSGAERVCLDLCEELQRRGHRVLLLCKPAGDLPAEAALRGIATRTPPIFGKLNLLAPWLIAAIARGWGADLIHSHLSTASLWGGLGARLARIPGVGHVHAINTFLYYRLNDLNLTCSDGVRRAVLAQNGDPARVRVVYNGIPLARLQGLPAAAQTRAALGLEADDFVLVCVAHLTPRKGQIHLLRAIALLREAIPELRCLLVGEGTSKATAELRREAARLGITDRVRFLGFRHDAVAVTDCSDVSVLPSVSKEGLGLGLIEAALLGKPAIGSAAPGIDEVIDDGISGLLVPHANPQALAAAIDRLWRDPEMRLRFGEAGRARAQRTFSLAAMADACEAAYSDLLQH